MFVKSVQGEKGYQLKEIIPPENYPFTIFPCTNLWTITEERYSITEAYSEVIRSRIYIQLKNKNKTSMTHI